MAATSEGKAIPFIVLEDEKLKVCDEAKEFLASVEAPTAVIAVAGMARTGKSVLLNQILLGKPNGFHVGSTIASCTRGIWLWNKTITQTRRDGTRARFLVIDTEGIGSVEADEQHDASILSLALLLSSYFIYNAFGAVDERALNQLSLIANLTSHLRVHAASSPEPEPEHEHGGKAFAPFFPQFLWLLRDFSLQMVSPDGHPLSPKQYLERSLQPTPGAELGDPKEAVRRTLVSAFRERDCFTLVRPVTDEKLLQDLSRLKLSECRPEFAAQAFALREKVLSEARPKAMNNAFLGGAGLAAIAERFTAAISGGGVPSIVDTFSYVQKQQNRRALDAATEAHAEAVAELQASVHPLTDGVLEKGLHAAAAKARRELGKRMYAGGDGGGEEEREELEEKVVEAAAQTRERNAERGRALVAKMYGEVEKAIAVGRLAGVGALVAEHVRVKGDARPIVPRVALVELGDKLEEGAKAVGAALERKAKEEGERALRGEEEVRKLEGELERERAKAMEEAGRVSLLEVQGEESRRESERAREDAERERAEVERVRGELERERGEGEKLREQGRALRAEAQERAVQEAAAKRHAELATTQAEEARAASEEAGLSTLQAAAAAEKGVVQMEALCEALVQLCAAGTLQREWADAAAAQAAEAEAAARAELEALVAGPGDEGGGEEGGGETAKSGGEGREAKRLEGLLAVSEGARRRWEGQAETLKEEVRRVEERAARLADRVEEAQRRAEEAEEQRAETEAAMARLRQRVEAEEVRRSAARGKEEEAKEAEGEQIYAELAAAGASLRQVEEERDRLQFRVTRAEEELRKSKEEAQDLTAQLQEALGEAERAWTEAEERWKGRVKEKEAEWRGKAEALQAEHDVALQGLDKTFDEDRSALSMRIMALEKTVEELREEGAALMEERRSITQEYEAAIQELEHENQLQMSKMMVEYERKLRDTTAQKEEDTQKRIDALSSRIEGSFKGRGADGEDTELVTSMSKVIAQKAAEMEMFKESSDDTVVQLNKLIEKKDDENGRLKQRISVYTMHCLKVQCRYCGRDVSSRAAADHIPGCMQRRGITGYRAFTEAPPVGVEGAEERQVEGRNKTFYLLRSLQPRRVQRGPVSYAVWRRYKETASLAKHLRQRLPRVKLPDLGQGGVASGGVLTRKGEEELVARRREAIAAFFAELLSIAAAVECPELAAFLDLDRQLALHYKDAPQHPRQQPAAAS